MNKKGPRKMFPGLLEDPESSRRVHWGHGDVLSLVEKVGEHWQEFCNGVRKKKFIWKDIADEMGQNGFVVSGDECDRKWRNLKIRYLAVLEKQMSGEKSAHRIDYFEKIHAFLNNDPVTLAYLEQRSVQQKCKTSADQNAENEEEEPDLDDGILDWSDRAVQLLLDLLLEFRDWFTDQDNNWDDSTIWETISEQMKLEGYQPSSEQCCHKWASLTMEFQHHKTEAEATGSVPLWPYYTRVRHVLAQVGRPTVSKANTSVTLESGSKKSFKRGMKRTRNNTKMKAIPVCKQEIQDIDIVEEQIEADTAYTELEFPKAQKVSGRPTTAGTVKNALQPGDIREVCQRLENIEENMAICRRLDHLEAQLDGAAEQRRAQQQTNTLLSQVLTELSALRRTLSTRPVHKIQDPTDLSSGITIVVPQSQQLQ
ncbi:uncharacterized protein LOC123503386 isoform X2 [Portunus trituberculatus]|uniref:uncharacterized protein LOC123503386 isoform X2 n=1 Tax=Portunus trituberculatus TaxID=210409 RepID=UPI001E1D0EFE|nr:uncharacterized protein LOC123503386 isoform X2 [Portunus trituberculatus]